MLRLQRSALRAAQGAIWAWGDSAVEHPQESTPVPGTLQLDAVSLDMQPRNTPLPDAAKAPGLKRLTVSSSCQVRPRANPRRHLRSRSRQIGIVGNEDLEDGA